MKYVLLGSTGHVSKALTEKFVKEGITPTVVTRSEENAKVIRELKAIPAIGDVDDVEFLTNTFKDADSVFIVSAVSYFVTDFMEKSYKQMNIVIKAIIDSNVQNVVYLSSIGAHKNEVGLMRFHHINEELMKEKLTNVKNLSIIRAAKFYANFDINLPTIKGSNQIFSFYDTEKKHSLVDLRMIADIAFRLMTNPPKENIHLEYAETERLTTSEIANEITKGLNLSKPLEWIKISNKDSIDGLVNIGMNRETITELIESLSSTRHDDLHEDIFKHPVAKNSYPFSEFVSTIYKSKFDNM